MKIDFLKVVSLDEAIIKIKYIARNYIKGKDNEQQEKLTDCLGKTVAMSIKSPMDLPEFNRSSVDGYALRVEDIQGASESIPGILTILGEVNMGSITELQVEEGSCVYVPTGGMIPKGANGMIMIEDTEKLDDKTLLVYKQVKYGSFISYQGDDVKEGEELIQSGKRISPYDIGLLAGLGISSLKTTKEPRFSVFSTGDEIIDIDEKSHPGLIRDINGYGITAWIKDHGGLIHEKSIIKDNFHALKLTLESALSDSDVIILSGGSSMGVRDYTKSVIESFEEGHVIYHGLSTKPGKPTVIGIIKDKLILGLPGHPVAALMVCQHLVGVYLDTWFDRHHETLKVNAVITENIHGAPGRDLFQLVKLVREKNEYLAKPIYGKSGLISTLTQASGWIKISKDQEGVFAGDLVNVELLQEVRL